MYLTDHAAQLLALIGAEAGEQSLEQIARASGFYYALRRDGDGLVLVPRTLRDHIGADAGPVRFEEVLCVPEGLRLQQAMGGVYVTREDDGRPWDVEYVVDREGRLRAPANRNAAMATFYSDVRLHLDSGDAPLEVSASQLVNTRSWVLRIDGPGGSVVIHAPSPQTIVAALNGWAAAVVHAADAPHDDAPILDDSGCEGGEAVST
jgi:hypothetical protein